MEEQIIHINEGQRLSDIMAEIPTNVILNKSICGIGATTLEVTALRNSIIIEPNVPVIRGKEGKHEGTIGVYEGVTVAKIASYLSQTKGFKKIMTTPESFNKVKSVIRKSGLNLYRDFFILFDECEKIVQDVDFRKGISDPIDDFFSCESKAMVSATPIPPSDPRFEEQNFKVMKIEPTYAYKRKLHLWQTTNPRFLIRYCIQYLMRKTPLCIFYNSTKGIAELIRQLSIEEQVAIFCGTDSMKRLRSGGLKNVFDTLPLKNGYAQLQQVNFFTSRFYSAVDIDLPYRPIVIMLTEVFSTPHSMIDPATEAVQIAGRFRNGIKSYAHITNHDKHIEYRSEDEIRQNLDEQHIMFQHLLLMRNDNPTSGELQVLDQALMCVDYSRFVDKKGNKRYFMYDNACVQEQVKKLYSGVLNLRSAYSATGKFEVKSRYYRSEVSEVSEVDMQKLEDRNISKERCNRLVFRLICRLSKRKDRISRRQLEELGKSYNLVLDAYYTLGLEKVREIGFKSKDLQEALADIKSHEKERSNGVIQAVHNRFSPNSWVSTATLNKELKQIYESFNIVTDGRGIAGKIVLYYDAHEENTRKARGWKLNDEI